MRKKRNHHERDIQIAVVDHLQTRGRQGLVWFHVPNAPRSAITGAILKRMGMMAGVSDLLLFYGGSFFVLELKTIGGSTTPAQKSFLNQMQAAGGQVAVTFGLDDALYVLRDEWELLR